MGWTILKVLLLSLGVSVAIKSGGPLLAISATNTNATLAILLPPSLMALVLVWRWWGDRPQKTAPNPLHRV
jgi:membrane protein implicated in regulation of membrane protease activity